MNRKEAFKLSVNELFQEIDLPALLKRIAAQVKKLLNCAEASIFLYNPEREELYFEIATGSKGKDLKRITLKKGQGIVGWIAEQREPALVNDCSQDPRFENRVDHTVRFKTRSVLGIPVIMGKTLLGVLEAINKNEGGFTLDDLRFLDFMGSYVAVPLQNALLFRQLTLESREKERLIELAHQISSSVEIQEVFDQLTHFLNEIVPLADLTLTSYAPGLVFSPSKEEKRLWRNNLKRDRVISNHELTTHQESFPLAKNGEARGRIDISTFQPLPRETRYLINGLCSFVAIALEKYMLIQSLIEKERLEREMQIAQQIQKSLLRSDPVHEEGVDVDFINIPSSLVGGDYYEIIATGSKLMFSINDVAGHGLGAALIMATFRTNFIYDLPRDQDIRRTLKRLNDLLAETTEPSIYVTSFTAELNLPIRRMTFINAGHPEPLLLRKQSVVSLPNSCLPLGLFESSQYESSAIQLCSGDLLVLYTDGVTDAENPHGDMFGRPRLIDFAQTHSKLNSISFREKLVAHLHQFTHSDIFLDDITLITLKIK